MRPLAFNALFCATLCAIVWFPLTNTDIWWHLASAREMLANGQVLRVDPFSSDVLGQSWVDVHWLFQLSAYGIYRIAGVFGFGAS